MSDFVSFPLFWFALVIVSNKKMKKIKYPKFVRQIYASFLPKKVSPKIGELVLQHDNLMVIQNCSKQGFFNVQNEVGFEYVLLNRV